MLRRQVESAQYVSLRFGQRCRQAGIDISMGAQGSALDNAVCESFFGSLKRELLRRRSWPTRREAQSAIFEWIEGWYNPRRLHSTLGYLSPNNYEQSSSEEEEMKKGSRLAKRCPPQRGRSKVDSVADLRAAAGAL